MATITPTAVVYQDEVIVSGDVIEHVIVSFSPDITLHGVPGCSLGDGSNFHRCLGVRKVAPKTCILRFHPFPFYAPLRISWPAADPAITGPTGDKVTAGTYTVANQPL